MDSEEGLDDEDDDAGAGSTVGKCGLYRGDVSMAPIERTATIAGGLETAVLTLRPSVSPRPNNPTQSSR